MTKFAKIVELEQDEQVLLTINYNHKDDDWDVVIRTDFEGIATQLTLDFDTKEEAVEVLENYSKKEALELRESMERVFSY